MTPFLPSDLPIIQAPMANSQGSALAIAVCAAGGLGSLPCASLGLEQARAEMQAIRAATSAPFNVNFFCHVPPEPDELAQTLWRARLSSYYAEHGLDIAAPVKATPRAPFDAAFCALVEEIRPDVVSFHFGLPSEELTARVRASGAKILGCATTVAEALWLERRGVDAIIAQGVEAGGHRGVFLDMDIAAQPGLFALLPQVASAVRLPVIAAGGIADGRGIAASFALGASAVQIGTAYLRTPQALTSRVHREALKSVRDDLTRLTNLFTGRPARGIRQPADAGTRRDPRGRAGLPDRIGRRRSAESGGRSPGTRRLLFALGRRSGGAGARDGRGGLDADAVAGGAGDRAGPGKRDGPGK